MRRPVNSPYTITTEFGVRDTNAFFGYHSGVDYAVPVGTRVYAPASGKIVYATYNQTGGNMIIIFDGQFYHRLMHNSAMYVTVNQMVSEGDFIASSGTTGLSTGPHVHWDIMDEIISSANPRPTSFDHFKSPARWLNGEFSIKQGDEMFNSIEEVKEAYLQMRGVIGTDAEMRPWIGLSKQRWIQMSKAETDGTRAERDILRGQLVSVQQALANEQAKPPKEIIKEVQVIVEKPVEVIKEVRIEVPVEVVKEVNPSWLTKAIEFINNILGRR